MSRWMKGFGILRQPIHERLCESSSTAFQASVLNYVELTAINLHFFRSRDIVNPRGQSPKAYNLRRHDRQRAFTQQTSCFSTT